MPSDYLRMSPPVPGILQEHVKSFIPSSQVALFLHGEYAQLSIFSSHVVPPKPELQ